MPSEHQEFDRSEIIRKATREGYITIIELVGVLADDPSYIDILPKLTEKYDPRSYRLANEDLTTFQRRQWDWMTLIRRWGRDGSRSY